MGSQDGRSGGPSRYIPPETKEQLSSLIFTESSFESVSVTALAASTNDAASVNPQNSKINQTLSSLMNPPAQKVAKGSNPLATVYFHRENLRLECEKKQSGFL
jgi:hypothetical protein